VVGADVHAVTGGGTRTGPGVRSGNGLRRRISTATGKEVANRTFMLVVMVGTSGLPFE
jgi:hypothetical protein